MASWAAFCRNRIVGRHPTWGLCGVRLAGGGDFKDATAAKQDCYRATIRLDYNVEFFANCSFKNAFMSAHELMSAALL